MIKYQVQWVDCDGVSHTNMFSSLATAVKYALTVDRLPKTTPKIWEMS